MSVPDHLLGFLNIAKPHGVSSRSVVDQVQKHLRLQTGQRIKVGHSGTLDPFADGVLILGVGRATSLLQILQHGSKSYQATFCLGKTSETLDLESPVESVAMPDDLSSQQIEETLVQFVGDIQQVPPKHSAIRVAGKRAYELARKGRDFEMPSRQVKIHQLSLLNWITPHLELEVQCGGGTYIRTLGQDIANTLGTDAVMTKLTRTESCGMLLQDAIPLADFLERPFRTETLLSPAQTLERQLTWEVDWDEASRFTNGLFTHKLQARLDDYPAPRPTRRHPLLLRYEGQLAGVIYWEPQNEKCEGRWRTLVNLGNLLQQKSGG